MGYASSKAPITWYIYFVTNPNPACSCRRSAPPLIRRVRQPEGVDLPAMADRRQERAAIAMLIEAVRVIRSAELLIQRDEPVDFPDFILFNMATGKDVWVEVVEAVESGELISAERRAERIKDAVVREYRARGEEVVLTVSPRGVEDVTPSPGFGVSAILIPGPARKIDPPEWIARALERKGRADRYGPAERSRTTLLIDCSRELLIGREDAADLRSDLRGDTLGFEEVWCVSANWAKSKGIVVAP